MDERTPSKTSTPAPATRLTSSLRPIQAKRFGPEQARHLLWRAGFGGTTSQVNILVEWGPERSVDHLLSFGDAGGEDSDDPGFDKDIMRPPTAAEREFAAQARKSRDEDALAKINQERQRRERLDREQIKAMQKWWIKRMVETPRPLEEKLTLFWHGHLATGYRAIENSYHMYMQNRMFRRNALKDLRSMLVDMIRDPAMLAYLNNNQSRKSRPNENLAREIMELFALGIGNYSERDIKEGARALTGYTFEDDRFVFEEKNHDQGEKSILGASGKLDGDDFVDAILSHPAAAPYITRRLYNFFVADVPPDERGGDKVINPTQKAVIAELATGLRLNRYAFKPMLRRLFLSEHFYDPQLVGQQIKSPAQLIVGTIRSLNTPARDLSILSDALDLTGQNLFQPPSVKGWEGGRSWINTSTLFIRQNSTAFLLTGRKPSEFDVTSRTDVYDPMPLLQEILGDDRDAVRDPERVTDALLRLTLSRPPEDARDALLTFLGRHGGKINRETVTGCLLLITAMPEYQLC